MPEYEYGVKWNSSNEIIYAGTEDIARKVHKDLSASLSKTAYHDRPVLVRRPKGDWEKTK